MPTTTFKTIKSTVTDTNLPGSGPLGSRAMIHLERLGEKSGLRVYLVKLSLVGTFCSIAIYNPRIQSPYSRVRWRRGTRQHTANLLPWCEAFQRYIIAVFNVASFACSGYSMLEVGWAHVDDRPVNTWSRTEFCLPSIEIPWHKTTDELQLITTSFLLIDPTRPVTWVESVSFADGSTVSSFCHPSNRYAIYAWWDLDGDCSGSPRPWLIWTRW